MQKTSNFMPLMVVSDTKFLYFKNNDMTNSMMVYVFIGVLAGVISGFFGIGGGIIIVPALIYLAGFSQLMATGTSLAVLLPPIGLAATLEYYKRGYVNWKAAIVIALCLFLSAWLSARFATRVNAAFLRLGFGAFITLIGLYFIFTSLQNVLGKVQ